MKIQTWKDFDDERLRKLSTIVTTELKLRKQRERLSNWSAETINRLKATIGERK